MPRSVFAIAVDGIQRAVRPMLNDAGFRVRGRTFNRIGPDGLTHVINFWMGPSTSMLYGRFTINLGVYVPEVAEHHGGGVDSKWIQDFHCCVRGGSQSPTLEQLWWPAEHTELVTNQVSNWLCRDGLSYLDRFATRDKILYEWRDRAENQGASSPPRIVKALILYARRDFNAARELLMQQAGMDRNRNHPAYVRELAVSLGLGPI